MRSHPTHAPLRQPTLGAALVWLRRDLRLDDHAALHHALKSARQVWCAFVFDTDILKSLPRHDRRVEFIRDSLLILNNELQSLALAHSLPEAPRIRVIVRHGRAAQEIPALARQLGVQAVYASHDDDPYALSRDAQVRGHLADQGVILHTVKDHVIFERQEVLTGSGTPYGVFTPYKNAWLKTLAARQHDGEHAPLADLHVAAWAEGLAAVPVPLLPSTDVPSLEALGFEKTNLHALRLPLGSTGAQELLDDFLETRIDQYDHARDFPAVKGPSYLSTHLRFGTVSARRLAREAWKRLQGGPGSRGAEVWLSELIWRDFYHQILFHHPRVVTQSYKPEYDRIQWEHGKEADAHFHAWCEGRTGYPLVDAAMHQLNETGYMHNRLRMVVASFLVKDLGIDWRRGEAYFATHLNDFDLAANNGGWQWASSSGCDAQPYFRIFNPLNQSEKFDPQGRFIRKYLPQLATLPDKLLHAPWMARPVDLQAADVRLGQTYPLPIVDHNAARLRTLERYAVVKAAG